MNDPIVLPVDVEHEKEIASLVAEEPTEERTDAVDQITLRHCAHIALSSLCVVAGNTTAFTRVSCATTAPASACIVAAYLLAGNAELLVLLLDIAHKVRWWYTLVVRTLWSVGITALAYLEQDATLRGVLLALMVGSLAATGDVLVTHLQTTSSPRKPCPSVRPSQLFALPAKRPVAIDIELQVIES